MSAKQYITQAGLITRFGLAEVTHGNDPMATGTLDAEMLQARIADAHAEMDFYLSQRGLQNLPECPDLWVKIAADLVRALYFQPHPPKAVEQAEMRAREMLRAIASGQWDWRDLPSQIQLKRSHRKSDNLAKECIMLGEIEEAMAGEASTGTKSGFWL